MKRFANNTVTVSGMAAYVGVPTRKLQVAIVKAGLQAAKVTDLGGRRTGCEQAYYDHDSLHIVALGLKASEAERMLRVSAPPPPPPKAAPAAPELPALDLKELVQAITRLNITVGNLVREQHLAARELKELAEQVLDMRTAPTPLFPPASLQFHPPTQEHSGIHLPMTPPIDSPIRRMVDQMPLAQQTPKRT